MGERGRRRTAIVLLVVAAVTGALALCSVWLKRQVLETDQWAETSGRLLEDDDIRNAVGLYLSNNVLTGERVEQKLEEVLPPKLQPLATPIAGAFRQAARKAAVDLLSRPEVVDLWIKANRTAQENLVALLDNKPIGGDALDAAGDRLEGVTLDLSSIRQKLSDDLGLDLPVLLNDKDRAAVKAGLEQGDASAAIKVLAPDQLEAAQTAGRLLKTLPVVFVLLTIALYAAAIWVAPSDRRGWVAGCGFSLLFVGVAALALRHVAGDALVDALASNPSVEPATLATWLIGTSLLGQMAVATIVYALLVLAWSWLSGHSRPATAIRRQLAPLGDRPAMVHCGIALLLLILIPWAPTAGLTKPLGIVIIGGLLVLGAETLHRQVRAETADPRP